LCVGVTSSVLALPLKVGEDNDMFIIILVKNSVIAGLAKWHKGFREVPSIPVYKALSDIYFTDFFVLVVEVELKK
jgi:hypothetical protein